MWKNYKIKLHNITPEQRSRLISISHAFRYCYNWGLNYCRDEYENNHKHPSFYNMCTAFTSFRNDPKNKWLLDYEIGTCRLAFQDVKHAFKNFFNKFRRYPRFKSRKKNKLVFKVRGDRLCFHGKDNRYVRIPGFGFSKEMLIDCKKHTIPVGKNIKYHNVHVSFDGVDFWLSLSISVIDPFVHYSTNEPIGIDVGVRTSAYLSNGISFDPPDPYRVRVLEHRRRKLQSVISRDINKRLATSMRTKTKYVDIPKSKNQLKREEKLRKTYNDIHNLYCSHYHKISREIANMRPEFIVLEDLSIRRLGREKPSSRKYMTPAKLGILLHDIEYKCTQNGSTVIKAPSNYPSSQICSRCGSRHKIGSIKTYVCPNCGLIIDRDYNASMNLLAYGKRVYRTQ